MGHPSPSGQPEPVDERRGSVQGLISAGIVIGIFALWAGSASVLGWWITHSGPRHLALLATFALGTFFQLAVLLLLYLRARSHKRGLLAVVVTFVFFAANRGLAFFTATKSDYDYSIYDPPGGRFVAPSAAGLFLIGLIAGWTIARYRSGGAWFGLVLAVFLTVAACVGIYFAPYEAGLALVWSTDSWPDLILESSVVLLLIIGICLGVVTLSDTIGVAMRPTPVPALGYPVQLSPHSYPMPMTYPPSAHPPNPGAPFAAQHPQSPTMLQPNAPESTAP